MPKPSLLYKIGARIWYGSWLLIISILAIAWVIAILGNLAGEPPYYSY